MDEALVADWRRHVVRARAHLGWEPDAACVANFGMGGVSLAIAAPFDRLRTAMEINEWALCAALHDRDPLHWCGLRDALQTVAHRADPGPESSVRAEIEASAALARLARIAAAEGRTDPWVG